MSVPGISNAGFGATSTDLVPGSCLSRAERRSAVLKALTAASSGGGVRKDDDCSMSDRPALLAEDAGFSALVEANLLPHWDELAVNCLLARVAARCVPFLAPAIVVVWRWGWCKQGDWYDASKTMLSLSRGGNFQAPGVAGALNRKDKNSTRSQSAFMWVPGSLFVAL